jgi:hypothetical protein
MGMIGFSCSRFCPVVASSFASSGISFTSYTLLSWWLFTQFIFGYVLNRFNAMLSADSTSHSESSTAASDAVGYSPYAFNFFIMLRLSVYTTIMRAENQKKELSLSLCDNKVYTRCFTMRRVKCTVLIHHLRSYVLTGGTWCVFLFTMRDG